MGINVSGVGMQEVGNGLLFELEGAGVGIAVLFILRIDAEKMSCSLDASGVLVGEGEDMGIDDTLSLEVSNSGVALDEYPRKDADLSL